MPHYWNLVNSQFLVTSSDFVSEFIIEEWMRVENLKTPCGRTGKYSLKTAQ